MKHAWNDCESGQPNYSEKKTYLITTSSSMWTYSGSNPSLCDKSPANKRLSLILSIGYITYELSVRTS